MAEQRIGFLGTGLMGLPMAARLLAAGHHVTVWNRSPGKTGDLVRDGARPAATAADAAREADTLFLMLADGASVTDLLFAQGVADALPAGALVIDMSSIPPGLAQEHEARLGALGIDHLDAPVSGGTKGAAEGSLAIMVGGTAAAFARAEPLLEAMGRAVRVGPAGAGQLAKLANQVIVAVSIGAVAEALLLASVGGADPARVREALAGGFADSPILRQHGARMIDRDWTPGGPVRLQLKDAHTIIATARRLGLRLPMIEAVTALFETAMATGLGEHDHSALLRTLEEMNPPARLGTGPDQEPRG